MCGRLSRPQRYLLSLIWFVLSVALRSAIRLRLTEILRIGTPVSVAVAENLLKACAFSKFSATPDKLKKYLYENAIYGIEK